MSFDSHLHSGQLSPGHGLLEHKDPWCFQAPLNCTLSTLAYDTYKSSAGHHTCVMCVCACVMWVRV